MNAPSALDSLKALAQEYRPALYRLLVQAGSEGMAAGALGERPDCPAPLSAAISMCCAAGLVRDVREGRVIRWRGWYEVRLAAYFGR